MKTTFHAPMVWPILSKNNIVNTIISFIWIIVLWTNHSNTYGVRLSCLSIRHAPRAQRKPSSLKRIWVYLPKYLILCLMASFIKHLIICIFHIWPRRLIPAWRSLSGASRSSPCIFLKFAYVHVGFHFRALSNI